MVRLDDDSPVQAVYWQFDHALRVYPLPHALVLADSAPAADYTERKSGCVCINPVSSPPCIGQTGQNFKAKVLSVLGVLLQLSTRVYARSDASNDGDLNVVNTDEGPQLLVALNEHPDNLVGRKTVTLSSALSWFQDGIRTFYHAYVDEGRLDKKLRQAWTLTDTNQDTHDDYL